MASSIGPPGSYAKTLALIGKKEKGDKIPEFEPPQLENLERKLQILPKEWYEETYYKSDDVAALYSYYVPTQGPFIMIPSLQTALVQADFTLTSKDSLEFYNALYFSFQ
jgi:hypothetical protein